MKNRKFFLFIGCGHKAMRFIAETQRKLDESEQDIKNLFLIASGLAKTTLRSDNSLVEHIGHTLISQRDKIAELEKELALLKEEKNADD